MPRPAVVAPLVLALSLTACLHHSDEPALECASIDTYEPNDTEQTATDLGELHDDPDSSKSVNGSLSSLGDVDFFAVHIEDTGFGGDPNITVSVTDGYSVKTTFVCDNLGSAFDETKCLAGAAEEDGCVGTNSTTDENGDVTYSDDIVAASTTDCSGTADDNGILYIRVAAVDPSTCSYNLRIGVE